MLTALGIERVNIAHDEIGEVGMTVIRCLNWKAETRRKGRWCGENEKTTRSAGLVKSPSATAVTTDGFGQSAASR